MCSVLGWLATLLCLYGSFRTGSKDKVGYLFNSTGNALWAWIGFTRGMQLDLIVVSLAFVALYVHNFYRWHRDGWRKPPEIEAPSAA